MAKNYTLAEAVEIIAKGTDNASIADIGGRYPLLANRVATIAAKAGDSFTEFMGFMPEYLTANKINRVLKESLLADANESEEDEEVEAKKAPAKKAPAKKDPFEGKTAMELFKECKAKGIKAEPKKPAKYYIDLLTKADEPEDDEDEKWGDEEEVEKSPAKTKRKAKPEPKEDEDDEKWDI